MDDELDIYDDLDDFQEAENKKSKELEAWQTKFEAIQLEIANLQAENKTLAKKIKTMEVNFQNLLDTAKAEIKRKDAQITQLRKEKDDICFRRKRPANLEQHKAQQAAGEVDRQEHKRFKREAIAAQFKTEIALDNNNENWSGQIKAENQKRSRSEQNKTQPQDACHDKKKEHKHDNFFGSSNEGSRHRSSHDRDRDRERDRERDKVKDAERSRRRSHSRDRERDRAKSSSHRHRTNSKDLKRSRHSRSRSRSRSHSRSGHKSSHNKSSKANQSPESAEKHRKQTTKNDKRHKEKALNANFGSTPEQLDEQSNNNAVNEEVMQKLLANKEALTPQDLYTPASQIEHRNQPEATRNASKTVEEVDKYFVKNKRAFKQKEMGTELIKSLDYKTQSMEYIPGLDLTAEEEQKASPMKTEAEEKIRIVMDVEIREHIPGLDLIDESEAINANEDIITNDEVPERDFNAEEEIVGEVENTEINLNGEGETIPMVDAKNTNEAKVINDANTKVLEPNTELNVNVDEDDDNSSRNYAKAEERIPGLDLAKDDINSNEQIIEEVDAAKINEHIPCLDLKKEENLDNEQANIRDPKSTDKELEAMTTETEHESKEDKISNEIRHEVKAKELDKQDCEPAEAINEKEITEAIVNKSMESDRKQTQSTRDAEIKETNDGKEKAVTTCDSKTSLRKSSKRLDDYVLTPKLPRRSMRGIQIIEDIRLPDMMNIEHIAVSVDEHKTSEELEEVSNDQDSEEQQVTVGQIVTVNKTIVPELTADTPIVVYVPPDSTKLDHNDDYDDDDAVLEAVMNELILEKPLPKELQQSYPNLSLETDTIELALEQLHQSHNDEQPGETTVSSTSMKGLQTPKQDLVKILTQSPLQQPAVEKSGRSPTKVKVRVKRANLRSPSNERITPSSDKAESGEKTPLKKRKIHLTEAKELPVLHVTIDETTTSINESSLSQSSDTSIVTKRCSMGNSDYQFERINDEVVLRVTRRRRRPRPAGAGAGAGPLGLE
ncbi:zinc finger CCCH domain-containing protein 13 [Drosophila grimshawi]|uniref:zinc finger CCCH domain-containing protein 13 n=1 Tax=Drosophila grimshawi TaxID=7222 RepID=UPI001C93544F|nr:zinc finger CCCH domain-containing protein 13 [Drosophila grimshawi]